jgi:hypothetical protein
MTSVTSDLDRIPGLRRIESFPPDQMSALARELTRESYSYDEVYGKFCTLEEFIDCPPSKVFEYLADARTLEEWTYSLRDFEPAGRHGLYVSADRIGGQTRIYTRAEAHADALTVDYHCAWDQGEKLWMIYLMRVVNAEVVLDRPGSVVLWTNCKHPYYEKNPFPEKAPASRPVWVGDLWPFFYAGHWVEMQNLKHILEYRHRQGLPIRGRLAR